MIYDENYDLWAAFNYCITGKIGFNDVQRVVLKLTGENDGASWHWFLELKDGNYAYMSGGCDYTGWDCQAGAEIYIAPNITEALLFAGQDVRWVFEDMIVKGESVRVNDGGI